jgi:HK97 family phage portal protein
MGIFSRLERRADVSWSNVDDRWYQPVATFAATLAGFPIGPDTALRVSAVFGCCSLIAETVASLPVILQRRLPNGGKERAKDHRLYRTLRYRPNGWMTAMDFYGSGQMHLGLRGSMYYEIKDDGRDVALLPMHPDRVRVDEIAGNRLRYDFNDPKTGRRPLRQEEVLHVRDLPMDGMVGQARATLAREAIAVAAAAEAFVGGFFKNDATGRLLIKHPGQLSEEKRAEFRKMIQENYAGWANRSKAMLLSHGVEATELGAHKDSGFLLDPRKFQVSDIARFWRVPSFMIGMEEKNTAWGTGIEQMTLGFVTFTIKSWTDRWAQAMMASLLTEEEQEDYVIEFLFADLLRGDLMSRTEALAIQRNHGVINANEWRAFEGMNPREDGGDEYQDTPSGTAPSRQPERPATEPPDDEEEDEDEEQAIAMGPLLQDAVARIAAAETREVEKRATKARDDPAKWLTWLQKFYGEHREYAIKVVTPLVEAQALPAWVAPTIGGRVEQTALLALAQGVPEGWRAGRAAELATIITETLQAGAAVKARAA